MEKAIKLAIEKGGFQYEGLDGKMRIPRSLEFVLENFDLDSLILDPLFWQALGKACGWEGSGRLLMPTSTVDQNYNHLITIWEYHALRFFEIKLTNGNEEVFWSNLLMGRTE